MVLVNLHCATAQRLKSPRAVTLLLSGSRPAKVSPDFHRVRQQPAASTPNPCAANAKKNISRLGFLVVSLVMIADPEGVSPYELSLHDLRRCGVRVGCVELVLGAGSSGAPALQ